MTELKLIKNDHVCTTVMYVHDDKEKKTKILIKIKRKNMSTPKTLRRCNESG